MCGFLASLTGLAIIILVILHPVGWLVLVAILIFSGTAGITAFFKSLLRLGKPTSTGNQSVNAEDSTNPVFGPFHCHRCSNPLRKGMRFCSQCGTKFDHPVP